MRRNEMKHLILALLAILPALSFAKEVPWSVEELRRRFQVRGEMYDLDVSGKVVQRKGHTWNIWKPIDKAGKIQSQWSSVTDNYTIAIRHSWEVQDSGSIKVLIEQYKTVKRKNDPIFEDLIKKEERIIENLEPITLIVFTDKDKRVVARFTPDFAAGETARNVSEIPLAGNDVIITDNEGYVWAMHATHGGKYSGFATYKGTIFLSYYPFAGSKELGVASGNEMEIHITDKKTLTFTSKTSYLPDGIHAKVYGIYYPDRKSGKFPAAALMDRNDEKEYVERIKTWPN
jgi:hypothetical protein